MIWQEDWLVQVFNLPCLKETLIEHITKNTDFDDFCSNEATTFILDLFVRTRIYFLLEIRKRETDSCKSTKEPKSEENYA